MTSILVFAALVWLTATGAQTSAFRSGSGPEQIVISNNPLPKQPQIRIGPGDLIEITVFDSPELNQTVRVNDIGEVSLTLIGKVQIADLSIEQAQELVSKKYVQGKFILNPQVSILVREYMSQGVSVLGEVNKPGVYPVLGHKTLFDVLSEAGGITRIASNQVSVKRRTEDKVITVTLSGRAADPLSDDILLSPGDKVVVPRAGIIYVIGDVNQPGGYVMQNDGRLSLLQAVAMALGTRQTASLNKARLIRKTESGYVESQIALGKILNGKSADMQLQAEDILYIPNSAGKSMLYRGIPGAVNAASYASIYRAM